MEKKPINTKPFGKTQCPPIEITGVDMSTSSEVVIHEWQLEDGAPLFDFFAQAEETPENKLCFWIDSRKDDAGAAMYVPKDWTFEQAQEYYDNLQKTEK
jgi:hypothetical protein